MICTLDKYVLPTRFIERYRPVKSHPNEKALGGYCFDHNAARFFICMATADTVPPEVVWTVVPPTVGGEPFHVVSGLREELALGYVICQVPFGGADDLEFPLSPRLTYRARIRITTLQGILDDIRKTGQFSTGSEIAGFIQCRIEELKA